MAYEDSMCVKALTEVGHRSGRRRRQGWCAFCVTGTSQVEAVPDERKSIVQQEAHILKKRCKKKTSILYNIINIYILSIYCLRQAMSDFTSALASLLQGN